MPFQMHGQMYLMQGPFFYLKKDKYTRYAQLYIFGPQLPASLGASNNSDLDRKITSNLDVLSTEIPFVGLYKAIYELFMNAESSESITLFVWTYPSTRITLVFDVKIQPDKAAVKAARAKARPNFQINYQSICINGNNNVVRDIAFAAKKDDKITSSSKGKEKEDEASSSKRKVEVVEEEE
ncbi:hypothetical protein EDC96DRAFT_609021 [Choanephora cucurbitarum]|nr:hypothetical protein EDC96DRAFT_609021 [Choanephora cucurbitarum]